MASLDTIFNRNGNYSKPVVFEVVAVSPVRTFTDKQNRTQEIVTAGIANGSTSCRASVYAPHIATVIAGRTFLAKNFTVHNRSMILKTTARVFRTASTLLLTDAARTAAEHIVNPPSTATVLQGPPVNNLVTVVANIQSVSVLLPSYSLYSLQLLPSLSSKASIYSCPLNLCTSWPFPHLLFYCFATQNASKLLKHASLVLLNLYKSVYIHHFPLTYNGTSIMCTLQLSAPSLKWTMLNWYHSPSQLTYTKC